MQRAQDLYRRWQVPPSVADAGTRFQELYESYKILYDFWNFMGAEAIGPCDVGKTVGFLPWFLPLKTTAEWQEYIQKAYLSIHLYFIRKFL